jgi:hypothetical protein
LKAKPIKGSLPDELNTASAERLKDGYRPKLATVFLSQKKKHKAESGTMVVKPQPGEIIFTTKPAGLSYAEIFPPNA